MTELSQRPSRSRPRPAAARTVVPGAAMIAVSYGLARYGYGLLLPEMQSELAIGPGTAGLISSGTYLSYLLANIGSVWVNGRFGARVTIGLAAALATTGMAAIAVATSAPVLAAGVLVAGAAAGLALPPYADLVARQVPESIRDIAWSTISSGTGWGVAIAGPIAIVAGDGWRLAWGGFVLLAIAVGAAAALLTPRADARAGTGRIRRPQLSWTWFFCPKSRPLLVSAVLIGAGSAVWWVFSVDALRAAGLDPTPARIVYAVCGAAGVLGSFSGAAFARFGLRRGYLASCALLAASLATLGLATGRLLAALLAAVLFGVFYNSVIAAQLIWSSRVFADHPAAGLAAVNSALTLGTLAGPVVAGVLITHAGHPATLIAAASVTLAALTFCPPSPRRQLILAAHRCRAAKARP
ncbi:MFS transporter [Flindersiella endophytica]